MRKGRGAVWAGGRVIGLSPGDLFEASVATHPDDGLPLGRTKATHAVARHRQMSMPCPAAWEPRPPLGRLAPMTGSRGILPILAVVLLLAACSAAGGAAPTTPVPTQGAAATASDGATSPGDPGASLPPESPVSTAVPPGQVHVFDPNNGPIVIPKPGQLDVHPTEAQTLRAAGTGPQVGMSIAYASGVEPCNVLDSILVKRGPGSFEMTLREGHGPGGGVCPDLAEFKRACAARGGGEPRTYTITDGTGVAKPISVAIP